MNDGVSPSSLGLLFFVSIIILNGIIAAAHSALINARKTDLRTLADSGKQEVERRRAKRVLAISENSTRLLASRQLMSVTLHTVAAGILTLYVAEPIALDLITKGADSRLARWGTYFVTWVIGAVLMITLGELIPDILASSKPESSAMFFSNFLSVLFTVTAPITRLMTGISTALATSFGDQRGMAYVTEEEIKTLVDAGSEEGMIEDEAKEMIYSIFQFGDKVVSEVMVPRLDMNALEAKTPLGVAIDVVLANGHSRTPIYEETIDKIIGLLYTKDLLSNMRRGHGETRPVKDIIRPAYFIPESKKAGSLLEELQQRKIHMAIVVDEYGGTAGLITIEDLLEEIVGEIQDEYDPQEEAEAQKISETEYLFDAGIALADVNNMLEVGLPTEESDTLGGYIFSVLGKIPLAGESFIEHDLDFKVETIVGRRIRKVRVLKIMPPEPEPESAEGKG